MLGLRSLSSAAVAGALIATAGCTTNTYVPPPLPQQPVNVGPGAGAAYLFGDVISGRRERAQRIIRAGGKALAPTEAGAYMSRQEAELRRETAGTGVDVLRQGNILAVRMPSGLTFDHGSSEIKPQFRSTLNEVARILSTYRQTYVDILGHTDTSGTPEANQALSLRRADSVRTYLVSRRVNRVRIATRGFGESMPLKMPETTEADRAANRRVEIKVVPFVQGDQRR